MILKQFTAKWFTALDWAWREAEVVAVSEVQARKLVDKLCPSAYRTKEMDGGKDTLQLTLVGDFAVPFFLTPPE